jgi:predicted O-methyltransferase YrrM
MTKDLTNRIIDHVTGLIFPYYTHNFLEKLNTWNIENWRVFEYGGGDSTIWWRKKAKECISIDTNKKWSESHELILLQNKEEFINYPCKLVEETGQLFDCIIIDNEPVQWRDFCTEMAIKCIRDGGILIIDNWLQNSIEGLGENDWHKSKKLLKNYNCEIFKQNNHKDWKTGYWMITRD